MVSGTKYDFHWVGAGEEGQFGVWVANEGPISQGDIEDAVNELVDRFAGDSDWGITLRSTLAIDQAYNEIRGYWYPDASGPAAVSAVGSIGNAQGVGTGGGRTALQSAMVVTLRTGHAGASYRGRCYVPITGTALDAAHQIDDTTMDAIAGAFAGNADGDDSLLRACGTAMGDGHTVAAVYSRKLGLMTPITSVRIDSVVDVQRRRAMSQVAVRDENYPVRAI